MIQYRQGLARKTFDPFCLLRESLGPELNCDPQNVFFRCVEDSNEAIMITDRNGKLIFVNPAWCRIYGFSREEALGQTPRLLHSGMQTESFYKEMWDQIRDPQTSHWRGELVNRAKDGAMVPVLLTITPVRSQATSDVLGYMGTAVDLSSKRELEAKVAHQDRLASIGLLASGLAHEIGTPLGVVRGRAEYLMMQSDNPLYKRSLGVITAEIDRISKLIRSLLRISRSFSDVELENVSPSAAVAEVLALVGQNLREDRVDVNQKIPTDIKIKADFNRLEQVLLNLIMNSTHAIKKARTEGRAEGHGLSFESQTFNGKTVLKVVDTGCGITPENMKLLFKPFFTTKDIGEGTGLGLAIVQQLMREMGAQIRFESTAGKGTSCSLVFDSA